VAAGLVGDGRQRLRILERTSGRLAPGRLTLLLGAPASGKSTLLHALAGALHGGALKARPPPPMQTGCRGAGVARAGLRRTGPGSAAQRGAVAQRADLHAPPRRSAACTLMHGA
jgi:ABC-type taurine transport system ATPase subunit